MKRQNLRLMLTAVGAILCVLGAIFTVWAYEPVVGVQRGYPGLGMEIVETEDRLAAKAAANVVPAPLPPASQDGQLAIDAYQNVRVLGHITSGEMTRLMTAMTTWVSPDQGCAYCHAPERDADGKVVVDEDGYVVADAEKLWSDELYTKVVARRMLQMTWQVNSQWQTHVKATGVTCYTCHRGKPVPENIWFDEEPEATTTRMVGNRAGQNNPSMQVGLTSLPTNSLRPYLAGTEGVRIISTQALPLDNRASTKQAEYTYGFMMHISSATGVNCTHCHNTRSMAAWDSSPPARAQAWYGIRMTRELNASYLEPLVDTLPPERLGRLGDAPKAHCGTCHAGAYRPLLGVSMLKDYPVLAEAKPQPEKTPVEPAGEAPPGEAPPPEAVPADPTNPKG